MKILFAPCHYVYDNDSFGSEISWAYNIGNRISKINPKSVVVTGFSKVLNKTNYKIIQLQKNKSDYDRSIINAIIFNILYTLKINSLLKHEKFDITHHVMPFLINRTFNLSNKNKTPFIIGPIQSSLNYIDQDLINDNRFINFIKKLKFLSFILFYPFEYLLKVLSKKTLFKADKIIVINNYTKNLLLNLGIDSNKIMIIPPGIDSKRFSYIPFNKKNNKIFELITVGYLIDRKGIDLIIKAIKIIVDKNYNVRLRILGDGPQIDKLKSLSESLGLKNHIIFEGYVEHKRINKYYQKSHLFLSMSRSESWGQMYLESMSCGLPVITTKNFGSLEIIKENYNGFLIDQEDYISLAFKIISLINNKNKIKSLSINSRKDIEKNYDWDSIIIKKYIKLYSDLMKK